MQRKIGFTAVSVGLVLVLGGAQRPLHAETKSSVVEIRKELLQLPYYGVFDFLAFSYDKGTVTLMGYAYHPTLKRDAVRAAKRASGVDEVIDKSKSCPCRSSTTTYGERLLRDLSGHVPLTLRAWRRPAVGAPALVRAGFHAMSSPRFPGMEPLGDYPFISS